MTTRTFMKSVAAFLSLGWVGGLVAKASICKADLLPEANPKSGIGWGVSFCTSKFYDDGSIQIRCHHSTKGKARQHVFASEARRAIADAEMKVCFMSDSDVQKEYEDDMKMNEYNRIHGGGSLFRKAPWAA